MSFTTPRPERGHLRRLAATIGTLATAAALTFGAAAPANAAPNINPEAIGSITVHKFEEPLTPSALPNDGSEIVDTGAFAPISGVDFTVQQVNKDLKDPAQWQGLENYTVTQAQANLTGTPTTHTTATGTGIAKFVELPVGLYLVTETGVGNNNIAFRGEPFLVTIPLAQNNDWNYNVHVYPKNTVSALTKSADDSAAHVIGDAVTYTLTGEVPAVPKASPLTAFGITDTLDSRLSYTSASVTVQDVALEPTDYIIGASGQAFKLEFTESGLVKLRANAGKTVTVTLNTTVNSLGDGAINNTGQIFVNSPGNTFNSNTVKTSWGALKITKHAADDTSLLLKDAEFELFALDSEGLRIGDALRDVTGSDSTFTTAADGTFTVNGLKTGSYELVETKAPLGYKLDSTPRTVVVAEGSLASAALYSVANTQVPAFQLPLTGSSGTMLFTGIGLLLVLAGTSIAVVRKRRAARA